MAVRRKKSNKITVRMQRKLMIAFMIAVALLVFLSIVLIRINIKKGYEYSKAVYDNYSYSSKTIPARRGDITDRNGTVLAYSTKVYNLIIDAKVLLSDSAYREPTVNAILECFEIDSNELNDFLDENVKLKEQKQTVSSYKKMATELTEEQVTPFENMMNKKDSNIKGVWFEEQYKRIYPYNALASDVIGFASEANGGEIGLESSYESELAGVNGRLYGYINDSAYDSNRINATNGNTLVTTLDYTIQNIIEESVKQFNEQYGSKSTAVIVMDPDTGEILGMSDYPNFDLNNPRDLSSIYTTDDLEGLSDDKLVEKMYDVWKNYCVSSIFEPGSVFKTFTIAEALEENVEKITDVFDCDGEGVYNGSVIKCHGGEGHGKLTLSGTLTESCNDALMQIGMDIGKEKFTDYFNVFKLGQKTGIDLPSEENGLLINAKDMMDVDLVTNAFGQNLNVTMVQMVSAFASVINGGYYYEPHLVKEIKTDSGDTVQTINPVLVSQTISAETSKTMREMLRAVVDYGTGGYVYLDGYSIGGKTGTAEKAGRNKDEYVVSFMGFAPAENPEVLVYVVIDTPDCEEFNTSWAAQMLSRDIFQKLLPYMGITPDDADYDADIFLDVDDLETPVVKRPYTPAVTPSEDESKEEETPAESDAGEEMTSSPPDE